MEQDAVTRRCIAGGGVKEKEKLLRFVVMEEHLVPDLQKKLQGRGLYIANSRQKLEFAVKKKLFSRAAKQPLLEEKNLVEIVENILQKRGLEFLGLAKKSGVLAIGLDKVCEKLKQNQVEFVLEAKDAGADGQKKIANLLQDVPFFSLYNMEELDAALGKVNTVHVAFLKSNMSKTALKEFMKINTFFNENK